MHISLQAFQCDNACFYCPWDFHPFQSMYPFVVSSVHWFHVFSFIWHGIYYIVNEMWRGKLEFVCTTENWGTYIWYLCCKNPMATGQCFWHVPMDLVWSLHCKASLKTSCFCKACQKKKTKQTLLSQELSSQKGWSCIVINLIRVYEHFCKHDNVKYINIFAHWHRYFGDILNQSPEPYMPCDYSDIMAMLIDGSSRIHTS